MPKPQFAHVTISTAILAAASSFALMAPSAKADTCGPLSYSSISTSGFSCQLGDKTYSNFEFTGTGDWTSSSFSFSNTIPAPGLEQHTFNGTGTFSPGFTYNYTYKMAIDSPAGPNEYQFDAFRTGLTSSSLTGTNLGLNTLTATGSSTYGPSISSTANGGGIGNVVDITTGSGYLGNDRGPLTFNGSIVVSQGQMNVFTDSVSQRQAPGPLPILGAGAAFGFSRKLRNRIKSAA